ncbi:MAG: ABC transporter permease [Planctomycetaceae bacterium]|nr:ABC transporter permease [Planctomycetales bacterium]MCB9923137.1 ABC transporter permease [Planctomycetaceae bacterium]
MINPLIQREFFSILRTRKALAMLITLSIAFSMIVLLRWPTDGMVDLSGMRSQQVYRVFAYTLLAGVLFIVPAFPAVSFIQEKNQGTLALLLNSPLNSSSIYFGKLLGSLLFALLLLLTSLPAASACYAMGGIDIYSQLGLLYLVLLLCTVQYTTLALLISTFVQSTDAAVRMTYAAVFVLGILGAGPYYLLQGQTGTLALIAWWLQAASPLTVIMDLVGHGDVGSLALLTEGSTLAEFILLSTISSFLFVVVTVSRLNHRLFDRARSKGQVTDDRQVMARGFRRLFFLVDPQRRKSGIPFYANPVMVKEFRTRKFGRIHWLLRLVSACAVLSLLLTFAATTGVVDWGVKTIGGFMVLLQILLVVLITPSLASGLISSERESGGWELLRMTPMSPLKILRGKLLSVIWTVGLILLATVPGYLVMIYIQPAMWLQVYLVMICLVLAAVYTVCVASAVGSMFQRTASATTTCYITLIVLFLGPLLIWMGRDAPFSHNTVETALSINPTGAALSIIEAPGFELYELVPSAWWASGIISVVALVCFSLQVWRISRPV